MVLLTIALTFVLGCTAALAFYLVGGPLALQGTFVISSAWPLIYPLLLAFAVLIGLVVGRLHGAQLGLPALGFVILAAWLGEYAVLASGALADELTPSLALQYWPIATAGPLQPLAAFTGALIGRRR